MTWWCSMCPLCLTVSISNLPSLQTESVSLSFPSLLPRAPIAGLANSTCGSEHQAGFFPSYTSPQVWRLQNKLCPQWHPVTPIVFNSCSQLCATSLAFCQSPSLLPLFSLYTLSLSELIWYHSLSYHFCVDDSQIYSSIPHILSFHQLCISASLSSRMSYQSPLTHYAKKEVIFLCFFRNIHQRISNSFTHFRQLTLRTSQW